MRLLTVLVPLVGTVLAAAIPLVRYALRDRYERTAIEVVQRVHEAQRTRHAIDGGYATDASSLVTPCGDAPAVLDNATLSLLEDAGYALVLRPADGAAVIGADCHGRAVADDYYVAAAPASSGGVARQAFAGRSDGQLFLFHDGVAPREVDIEHGLATPVAARETFKIP